MTAQPTFQTTISIGDYLLGEKTSVIKHEYLDGQIVAMAGANRKHVLLTTSLSALLHARSRARGCQLFARDMKLGHDYTGETYFCYPDLMLTCADDDRHPLYCNHSDSGIHLDAQDCDISLSDIHADLPGLFHA
jgi:Uma2 family endonuclease